MAPPNAERPLTAALAATSVASQVAGVRAWLSSIDVGSLSDRERVDVVAELERLKGAASAAQARATDHLRRSREEAAPRDAARSVGSEVALARRESPSLGDRFVGLSRALVHEMPSTMRALTAGVIGERHAVVVVQATSTLSLADRAEVDRRVGPLLGRLGAGAAGRAARRVAAELDAASVVRRMEAAARSRRVTVRPAPDGMAYLTVLAPLRETVGAYAALRARAAAVVGGQCPEEGPDGRGVGAVMADTATRAMSGRAAGQVQPLEVHLVMTDTALLGPDARSRARGGSGSPRPSTDSVATSSTATVAASSKGTVMMSAPNPVAPLSPNPVMEPARIPGHGSVPAPVARRWIREADEGSVWLRRLYTGPDGRDLVAMDSRRRVVHRAAAAAAGAARRRVRHPVVRRCHRTRRPRPARPGRRHDRLREWQRQVRPVQLRQGSPRLARPTPPVAADSGGTTPRLHKPRRTAPPRPSQRQSNT